MSDILYDSLSRKLSEVTSFMDGRYLLECPYTSSNVCIKEQQEQRQIMIIPEMVHSIQIIFPPLLGNKMYGTYYLVQDMLQITGCTKY